MVDEQVLQGNWNEIRGKLKEKYGQLTEDDVRQYEGNIDRLVGLIQRKTGESREAIERYLDKITSAGSSIVERAGEAASHAAESVRHAAGQTSESIRSGYARGEAMVQQHPTSAVAVAFGAGMALGVVVGLLMGRSR